MLFDWRNIYRRTLPSKWRYRMGIYGRDVIRDTWMLGFQNAVTLLTGLLAREQRLGQLTLPNYSAPVWFRLGTADAFVVRQVFTVQQYAPLTQISNVKFIIDCGGNIGCSALYFMKHFPDAELVAIEPQRDNADLFRQNLLTFSSRVHLIEAAIWSRETELYFRNSNAATSSYEVAEIGESEVIKTVTLANILRTWKFSRIDILKIDIEGAEADLFSKNVSSWLPHTRNIGIELHRERDKDVFFRAMSEFNYELISSGETTICKNITKK